MSRKETVFFSVITGMLMWSANNILFHLPDLVWWLLLGLALALIFLGIDLLITLKKWLTRLKEKDLKKLE
ncbi:MAG: hypothetical protein PHG45_06065 [Dehalococcoidales bacterium]|jgi:hypothetical protein|nr:hypothetical protein [Dehalococcoidales bacterium]